MAKMIVEVSALVDFCEMDPEDLNEDGVCAVDGTYGIDLTGVPEDVTPDDLNEATLEAFHGHIGIACLDDFDILVRRANEHDDPEHPLGGIPFSLPAGDSPDP